MFYYLKNTSWTPTEPFHAIKHKGTGTYHPCTYQMDAKQNKYESFVYGEGWKRSKKGYLIPLFSGENIQEFKEYSLKYGDFCAFYSVTGKSLTCHDSFVAAAQQEYKVAMYDIEYFSTYIKAVRSLNQKIIDYLQFQGWDLSQRWNKKDGVLYDMDSLFRVMPSYSLMFYILVKPHLDVLNDDDKLFKHFTEVYRSNTEEKFPVCMRDRITFLFNGDIAQDYEYILNNFPIA